MAHFIPPRIRSRHFNQIDVHLLTTVSNLGAPEELSTDGGPPFTSSTFQEFLKTWCVRHRLSSVVYPQSSGWADLAVKTAKRIVKGNIGPQGSLDNDNVARAILQYRNTPIQSISLLPAQLLLHH